MRVILTIVISLWLALIYSMYVARVDEIASQEQCKAKGGEWVRVDLCVRPDAVLNVKGVKP